MNALILAAGYATRLYPLTKGFPKPLLDVGGRTILDHLLDQLEAIDAIARVWLITNHRFMPHFTKWRDGRGGKKQVELIDDGTLTNDDRLGAVGDLRLALDSIGAEDDLLVTAADNLLEFALTDFVRAFQRRPVSHLCVHVVNDPARLRRTGVVSLGEDDRVLEFREKPAEPPGNLAVPPIYLFARSTLPRVADYLAGGGSPEAPGHFIEWLCRQEPVHAHRIRGTILDIGTHESLAAARLRFQGGPPPGESAPSSSRP